MEKEIYDGFVREIQSGEYNCIVVKGKEVRKFKAPGVKTLLTLLNEDPKFLKDSFVFDSVVGKGAAALMILGKVKEVYADLISRHAMYLFDFHRVVFHENKVVYYIKNRDKTGLCPIERLSIPLDTPEEIRAEILKFIQSKAIPAA